MKPFRALLTAGLCLIAQGCGGTALYLADDGGSENISEGDGEVGIDADGPEPNEAGGGLGGAGGADGGSETGIGDADADQTDSGPDGDAGAADSEPDAEPDADSSVCPGGKQLCDGACVDVLGDPLHCGACGESCSAVTQCVQGKCECPELQTLCSDTCVDTSVDIANCGGCDVQCADVPAHSIGLCDQGTCGAACEDGFGDCDSDVANGCEEDLNVSLTDCGGCGVACATGALCTAGVCECPGGQTACGGACVDTATDVEHCGECEHACASGGACLEGSCECPTGHTECGTTCADVNTDPAHCGRCGHDCQGGECIAGRCQPVILFGGTSPRAIGVDETSVYWTVGNQLMRASKDGGEPTMLSGTANGWTLGLEGPYVYFSYRSNVPLGSRIIRVPRAGGNSQVLFDGLGEDVSIYVHEGEVYWADEANKTVYKGLVTGDQPVLLADGQANPRSVAVRDGFVYWVTAEQIMRVTVDGGVPQILVGQQDRLRDLAVDDTHVYFNASIGMVKRVHLVTGTVELVSDHLGGSSIYSVVIDDEHVYWGVRVTNSWGSLFRYRKSDGTRERLADTYSGPLVLAQDDSCIYWTENYAGTVKKIAK